MNDPFSILNQVRAPSDDYLQPGEDQAADDLLRRIVSAPPAPVSSLEERRASRRRRGIVILGAVLVGGVGTAAAATLLTSKPTRVGDISCYSEAVADPAIQVQLDATQKSAVDTCSSAWESGPIAFGQAPLLTECVVSNGRIAVLPGTPEVCALAGMAASEGESAGSGSVQPVSTEAPATVRRMLESIRSSFAGRCLSIDDATLVVQGALEDAGLAGDWTIERGAPLDEVRRCSAPAVDEVRRVITLVAVPG